MGTYVIFPLQVLLSNCTLISFMVAKNSGDVEKIFIDKSLCGKITDKISAGSVCISHGSTDDTIICHNIVTS
jgi:hypothetical protein